MKVFIVFLGLLIINVSFLVYQGDVEHYAKGQIILKALAEECAAGAALYFEQEEFSNGRLVFNYNEGVKYLEHILESTVSRSLFLQSGRLTYEVEFQDDRTGYKDAHGNVISSGIGIPSVTVTVLHDTEDIFRLPFIEVCQITRMARYELPGA